MSGARAFTGHGGPNGPGWSGWPPVALVAWRLLVGAVFVSEGVQKFVFPERLGPGRFAEIGLPVPDLLGYATGVVEVVCGAALLAGMVVSVAAVPLVLDMIGALALTKIPILWGASREVPDGSGFFDFVHDARTDVAMLVCAGLLVAAGAGRWAPVRRRTASESSPSTRTER